MKTVKKTRVAFKTYSPKQIDIKPEWFLVDVKGKILGRTVTKIADLLRGKGKTIFSQHVECGDFVVVINAAEVKLTGKKDLQKEYHKHSRYPGGLKTTTPGKLRKENPAMIIEHAVAGMIPNNKLKKSVMKRLKVYGGAEHEMTAHKPKAINL
jgi:large subunit ribosomal protein L13